MPSLSEKAFWESRHTNCDTAYGWIPEWDKLKGQISEHLPKEKTAPILDAGCGLSLVCENLAKDGYTEVTGVDFSENAIKKMTDRLDKEESLVNLESRPKYAVKAIQSLDFPENTFEFILDKFTLDSVYCDENYTKLVKEALESYHKVLKEGGKLFIISAGSENDRKIEFDAFNKGFERTSVKVEEPELEETGTEIFGYLFVKRVKEDPEA
eukprot:GAHX01000274.1.p1 GENE.GAHX01000274.1~~GAHX01000274.1.p1  ORF type:complete len:211 (+),score=54.50 GAHX01000274.1:37-669(+)